MKKLRNNSHCASTLKIALSTGLILIFAILLAIAAPANRKAAPRQDRSGFQRVEGADALGNYPDTSVPLSGDTTVTPDAPPTNTTSISVATNSNFKGTFAASPTTGVVTITDAHPAGSYVVTLTAFGPGGTTTKSFTLTVTSTPCGAGLTAGFTNAADVNAGFDPSSVAIGDFNGDGKQDLAVANFAVDTVSIRLGDGLGGFSGSTNIGVGSYPYSVAIGDFNGDGKQDLAVANYGESGSGTIVSIRLGDGLGGFSGSTDVSVGSGPDSVAIGDFNGDGKQDLAVVNANSNTVSIRLGDGLGGFSGSTEVSVNSFPQSVAIGDFNGDGKQDLAVANYGSGIGSSTVSIRLGDGLGGFSGSTSISVGSAPYSVAIGDFNGDGKQDLAVANGASDTASIRLGDGLGGFSGSTEVSVGFFPVSVSIGDFNGDGKQDLAVADQNSDAVSIRLGDGLGGFSGSTEVSVGSSALFVAIGDFNGDARQDLAVATLNSDIVSIRLGQCVPVPTPTPTPTLTPVPCMPVLTQSTSQTITTSFVPCHYMFPQGTSQLENSYWRAFRATFVGEFNVSSVSFGVYSANYGRPVTVRLYTNSGASFPGGTRTLIGSSTITVTPGQAGTVVATPLVATVPAGTSELVMELFTPDAQGTGRFQIGANLEPETGLSYWSSICSDCLLPTDKHIVFNAYGSCAGGTSSPTPTATATPTPTVTPTGTPCSTIFAEDFDSVVAPALPPGWMAETFCGAPMWVTSTTTPDSGPNDAFIAGSNSMSDKRLDTPDITISGQGAQVSFRNFYNLANGRDGAVLEISSPNINGGAFTDITNAAVGGSFLTGGYTTTISADRGDGALPLAGRLAWSGNSGGYINTVANLGPNVAGQTIRLRFRMGSWGNFPGWRIDTISVVAGSCSTPTPPPSTPTPTPTPTPSATATATAPPVVCTLTEAFENISTLVPSGWVRQNNSQPAGTTEWFQGNANFVAQSGSAYIAADFLNGSGLATISNWLLTPPVTLQNGAKFSFWTRTKSSPVFPDRLQVRMSTNGTSSTVGTLPTDVGDFTTLLLDINPTYTTGGYPNTWTNFVVTISGLGGPGTGRLAFRYFVENGGPSGANSDYIGLDDVSYGCNGSLPTPTPSPTPTPIPTPTPTPGTLVSSIAGTILYCSSPLANVRVNVTGTVTRSTLSDGSGNYQFTFLPWAGNFTVTPAKAALAPGTSGINTSDAIAVQRHFLQIGTPLSGCRLTAADVNIPPNGISTADAIAIQRFFLGLSTGIADVGKFQFAPASRSYTGNGTNWTAQNFDMVVLGDVTSPFAVP